MECLRVMNNQNSLYAFIVVLDIIRICFDRRDYQNKRVITTRFMNFAIKQKEKMMGQSA